MAELHLSRSKVFKTKEGKKYIDVRCYEARYAKKHNMDITITYTDSDHIKQITIPHEKLKVTNFIRFGKKQFTANFTEEKFGVKKGDKYKLYSYQL